MTDDEITPEDEPRQSDDKGKAKRRIRRDASGKPVTNLEAATFRLFKSMGEGETLFCCGLMMQGGSLAFFDKSAMKAKKKAKDYQIRHVKIITGKTIT